MQGHQIYTCSHSQSKTTARTAIDYTAIRINEIQNVGSVLLTTRRKVKLKSALTLLTETVAVRYCFLSDILTQYFTILLL